MLTAGWCHIYQRDCHGSPDSGGSTRSPPDMERPPSGFPVGQTGSSRAGWLRGISQRVLAASSSGPQQLACSHLTCP